MMHKQGKILLVGFGPGAPEHMTYRAREAIQQADVVIGYSTYIKLVADLLEGKEVIKKGMTEELDRSVEAYEHAKQGKTVALVSSGDIGVYGMAGPTYELLLQSGWTPDSGIEVEVIPGSTALSACASLVGAPLTHDFCSISLSDLLTPWPVIARRIEAAARGDFVVALYNPKSGRRTRQIEEAQRILLLHRRPDTPVAIVKSAYRRKQDIQLVELKDMADCDIGMLTTVLVGNSSSFRAHNLIVTPRGYANKYDVQTGEAKHGEQAGRSLSMGLEGWHGCVRDYLRQHPDNAPRDLARHFDAPLGEILQALAGEDAEAPAPLPCTAAPLSTDMQGLVQQLQPWPKLRAVVRSPAGAIAELLLSPEQLQSKDAWLNAVDGHFHLHIDTSKVAQLWQVEGGKNLDDIYLLDAAGDLVVRLVRLADKAANQ